MCIRDRPCDPEINSMWSSGSPHSPLWKAFGILYSSNDWKHTQENENGELLIDKRRHWRSLLFAHFLTEHGIMQQFICGDKDAFRIAWLSLGAGFEVAEFPGYLGYRYTRGSDFHVCQRVHRVNGKPLFLLGKKDSKHVVGRKQCNFGVRHYEELYIHLPKENSKPPSGYCAAGAGILDVGPGSDFEQGSLQPWMYLEELWEKDYALNANA